jgi:hypothetical protein
MDRCPRMIHRASIGGQSYPHRPRYHLWTQLPPLAEALCRLGPTPTALAKTCSLRPTIRSIQMMVRHSAHRSAQSPLVQSEKGHVECSSTANSCRCIAIRPERLSQCEKKAIASHIQHQSKPRRCSAVLCLQGCFSHLLSWLSAIRDFVVEDGRLECGNLTK